MTEITSPRTWLQPVGDLSDTWMTDDTSALLLRYVWATKHPSWQPGDRIIYHASGYTTMCALVVVTAAARRVGEGQHQWRVAVRPPLAIAPSLGADLSDVDLQPIQDYRELKGENPARAIAALAAAVAAI